MIYRYIKNSNLNCIREVIQNTKDYDTEPSMVLVETGDNEIFNLIRECIMPNDTLDFVEFSGIDILDFVDIIDNLIINCINVRIHGIDITTELYNKIREIYCLYFDIDRTCVSQIENQEIENVENIIGLMQEELKARIYVFQKENPGIDVYFKVGSDYCAAGVFDGRDFVLFNGSTIKQLHSPVSNRQTLGLSIRKRYISSISNFRLISDIRFSKQKEVIPFVNLTLSGSIKTYWGKLERPIEIDTNMLSNYSFDNNIFKTKHTSNTTVQVIKSRNTNSVDATLENNKVRDAKILELHGKGYGGLDIARELGIRANTVYKVVYGAGLKFSDTNSSDNIERDAKILELHRQGLGGLDIARKLNISSHIVYRVVYNAGLNFSEANNSSENPKCYNCGAKTQKSGMRNGRQRYLCRMCGKSTYL